MLAFSVGLSVAPSAQAGLVGAQAALPSSISVSAMHRALASEEMRAALVQHGVSVEMAAARVALLSDAELLRAAAEFTTLPAGGAVVEATLIAFFIWALLNVTDYGDSLFTNDEELKTAQQ